VQESSKTIQLGAFLSAGSGGSASGGRTFKNYADQVPKIINQIPANLPPPVKGYAQFSL